MKTKLTRTASVDSQVKLPLKTKLTRTASTGCQKSVRHNLKNIIPIAATDKENLVERPQSSKGLQKIKEEVELLPTVTIRTCSISTQTVPIDLNCEGISPDDPNCWRIYAKRRYEDNYELYKKQKELEFKMFQLREENDSLEEENRSLREELERNVETIEDGRLLADYVQEILKKRQQQKDDDDDDDDDSDVEINDDENIV